MLFHVKERRAGVQEVVRVPALDGLRGVAIVLVVLWHYWATVGNTNDTWVVWSRRLLATSFGGVDLFFVLSGYLIAQGLFDRRRRSDYFIDFYLRRLFRVFPPYLLLVTSYILVSSAVLWETKPYLHQVFQDETPVWAYFAFVQNFFMAGSGSFGSTWLGVTWSLAVEEQFYLLLPILIRRVAPERIFLPLVALVVLAPLLRLVALLLESPLSSYVLLPSRMDALLLGVLVAWGMSQDAVRRFIRSRIKMLFGVNLVLVAGFFCWALSGLRFISVWMSTLGYLWIACTAAGLLLLGLFANDQRGPKLLGFAPLRWLGRTSYMIYLVHPLMLVSLHALFLEASPQNYTANGRWVTLAAFAASVIVSTVSWFAFERPVLRLGAWVRGNLSAGERRGT